MRITLGIASETKQFVLIFNRYFQACGYEVRHCGSISDAGDFLTRRELDLLVIDTELMSGSSDDWGEVAEATASSAIPVLAAGPMEKKDRLLEDTSGWAEALITYPMNPETVLQVIQTVLGDKAKVSPGPAADLPQNVEAGPEVTLASEVSAGRPQRIVSKALHKQPAWGAVEASRAILDQISDAIFVFARTGEMILVNETACRMLGYERDEILGRSAGVVFSQIENPPLVEGLDLRHAMSRFAVPPFDTVLRAASGHSIPVNFGTSFLHDEDGNVTGILGIARDIRERKQLEDQLLRQNEILEEEVQARTERIRASEARYRSLLEQIPFAVICSDTEGRVTSFNRAARRLFEWDDKTVGTALCDAWGCQGCEACQAAVKAQDVWAGECVMAPASGSKATMFHTCSPLCDDAGRMLGMVHAVSDLSDPSASQRELLRDAQGLAICDSGGLRKIVTRNKEMRSVLELIARCANSSATVLIQGESGTGKDLVAQALHFNSDRANGPYIVVNCATLDEHFLQSELFGHERGAFTGASTAKHGLLEAADGGTLLIDEVSDMSPEVQAMLLRVLETGRFRRLGSTKEKHADVRIIAATNKDLQMQVRSGQFRHDLFFRLNVLTIELPPLRKRIEDLPLLVEHFLALPRSSGKGERRKKLTKAALQVLMRHSWPGNIRELRNAIERARILSGGNVYISEEHFLLHTVEHRGTTGEGAQKSLAEVEREHIEQVLEAANGNKTKAAKVLGISRARLRRLAGRHELPPGTSRPAGGIRRQ